MDVDAPVQNSPPVPRRKTDLDFALGDAAPPPRKPLSSRQKPRGQPENVKKRKRQSADEDADVDILGRRS